MMANIEVIKWDGVSDKETIAATLWEYLDEDEKTLAKRTSYGDLGNYLKKHYGSRYHSGTAGDYFVYGAPNKIEVEIGTTRYILTWNKAAKLIHELVNQGEHTMTPLEEMDLSVRTFNCLRRAGITTIEHLTGMTREQFRSTLGLGSNCMNETEERMDEMGLSFREETAQKQYMSDNAQYAYTVHAQIILGAQMVENGLYQMAKGFKIMRDEKLYKDMGYNSFEAYCETETGMSRKQVYQYIAVVEKIPEKEFVTPGLQNAGIKKLYMLTTLNEEQREEIVQSADLESTTVKELKAKIDELTGQRDEEKRLKEDWQKQAREEVDRSIKRIEDLNDTIAKLEREIKELESRPINVTAVDVKETDEYKELLQKRRLAKDELLKMAGERNELRAKCDELQKQLDEGDGKKRYVLTCTERQMNKFCRLVKEYLADEFSEILKGAKPL
jgi:hypothetical protein